MILDTTASASGCAPGIAISDARPGTHDQAVAYPHICWSEKSQTPHEDDFLGDNSNSIGPGGVLFEQVAHLS